jgi:phosphonate transport system substrate-binding protein
MGCPYILKLTSCQAENTEFIGRAVADYIADRLGVATEFVDDIPWQERECLLDKGEIHAGWICGLPYVLKADSRRPSVELLAAPVMAGGRYGSRPVYFSDIVVHRHSMVRSFTDLRGSRWGYNEPRSHSGYNIVRYHLARLSEHETYFSHVTMTGAHQRTLWMIATGQLDASAIDSMVLEMELRRNPVLGRSLRVVETWGPSPAPPWVVSRRLPSSIRRKLRAVMLTMHREVAGKKLLRQARMTRFARTLDADYDSIRRMKSLAEAVATA